MPADRRDFWLVEAEAIVCAFTLRACGNTVVIEGLVDAPDADEYTRRVAEDIAGEGRVLVRVSCPKADPSGEAH